MRYELRLHRLILSMLVPVLVIFVGLLAYLEPSLANERWEATISILLVILVAAGLAYMGMAEGMIALYFGARHRRELWGYLLLGMFSLASGLYLTFTHAESLQTVSLIVAPHAFLFGLAELRLAQHLGHHPKQRRALLICGACELAMGAALVWGYRLNSRDVALLLGYVAIVTLLQLVPVLMFGGVPSSREPERERSF